jgi:gas vesicle protein
MIGTALGGPLGGAAAAFVADKLGLDNRTVEAVTDVLNSGKLTSEDIAKLKLAELDFKKFMADHDIKVEQLAVENQKSARDMQIATHSRMPAIITIMVTLGFFGILGLLFYHPELKGNEIVMIMVGQLSAVWAGCVAFYTGTTYGSANKNAMLANSQPAK